MEVQRCALHLQFIKENAGENHHITYTFHSIFKAMVLKEHQKGLACHDVIK